MSDMVKIEKEKYEDGCCVPSSDSHYPWGTSLDIRDDMVDSLGIGALSVGDVVEIRSFAVVTDKSERSSESEGESSSSKSIGLQLTEMSVNRKDTDRADQLYG